MLSDVIGHKRPEATGLGRLLFFNLENIMENIMQINHSDMVRALAKSGEEISANMNAEEAHLLHMAVGIVGEVIEIIQANEASDSENLLEEMGDVEFYFEGLCQGEEITLIHEPVPTLPNVSCWDISFALLQQAGEIVDIVKKITIYKDPTKRPLLRSAMALFRNSLDSLYYFTGITHAEAIDGNIRKLAKRYEGFKYSDQAAKERADKKV